jgi:predicted nucleic acid-binding protein
MLGHGLCADLFDIIVQDHQLVLGRPVLDEFERLLRVKFKVPQEILQELTARMSTEAEIIAPAGELSTDCPDPGDINILRAAQCARAHWLVTGDKPLLGLRQLGRLPIVSPRQLWDLLENR